MLAVMPLDVAATFATTMLLRRYFRCCFRRLLDFRHYAIFFADAAA